MLPGGGRTGGKGVPVSAVLPDPHPPPKKRKREGSGEDRNESRRRQICGLNMAEEHRCKEVVFVTVIYQAATVCWAPPQALGPQKQNFSLTL